MIQTRFATITGAVALWAMGSVAVLAFEQTPVAPAPAAPVVVPAPQPALSFGDETTQAKPKKKGRGLKLPVVGEISVARVARLPVVRKLSIPKLDFGLDLMYGSSASDETGLGFSAEPPADDGLTILGRFTRRF